MLIYKNTICFFSFITQNIWMGKRERERESKMAELAHTEEDGTDLPCKLSAFRVKIYPFWMPMQILIVTSSPTCCLHVDTTPPSMLSTQFMWHFRWGTCVLFTLGTRCISCYFCFQSDFLLACHPFNFCSIFTGEHLHPAYFRDQMHCLLFLFPVSDFLLVYHSCNLHGMLKRFSSQ